MVDWRGAREALAATRRYSLSHHEPADYDRTYVLAVAGRRVRLCARCSGVYPGVIAGFVVGIVGSSVVAGPSGVSVFAAWYWLLVLPLPALADWSITRLTDRRGTNAVRTATGLLLGYAYGLGLARLVLDGDRRVLLVGAAYCIAAAALLAVRFRRVP